MYMLYYTECIQINPEDWHWNLPVTLHLEHWDLPPKTDTEMYMLYYTDCIQINPKSDTEMYILHWMHWELNMKSDTTFFPK